MKTHSLDSGMHHITVNANDDSTHVITLNKNTQGSVFVSVEGSGELDLRIEVLDNSSWKYLWIDKSDETLNVKETLMLEKDAHLDAHYAELSRGSHDKNTHILFNGQGSYVDFKAAIMTFNRIKWKIKADHQARNSYAMVSTNAIVTEGSDLHLEVIGSISKGNSGSKTHQMSRILNLGENIHGIVYPMLLIDENDVEASHAASVGQANEDHIYYLQSRGLTRLESLKLIVKGYLMPITQDIEDPAIKDRLVEEIETKVMAQWQ